MNVKREIGVIDERVSEIYTSIPNQCQVSIFDVDLTDIKRYVLNKYDNLKNECVNILKIKLNVHLLSL